MTTATTTIDLLPQHRELLVARAISDDVAAARGYRSIGRAEARDLGFTGNQARPGLLIPLWRENGESDGYQLRPNEPRITKGKSIKYEAPKGQRNILDVPPTIRDELRKGRQVIMVTEGAFKADALATLGIAAVSIPGVYGWRGQNEDGGYIALSDWECINIKGVIFVLAFDSDILTKPDVHGALSRLKRFLEGRGADRVRVLVLPSLLSGKTGIDDYIYETEATSESLAALVVDELPAPPTAETRAPDGPVPDLAPVLDETAAFVQRYVVAPNHQRDAITLWVAHTHALDAADCTPYLNIHSPEKRSGKTRLLEVLEQVVARPWLTGHTTAAALARKVDELRPTLLLDESDAAFKGDKEYAETLRGELNTGHRRGGAVTVCVGQGKDLGFRDYSTFCPKAIAGIGKLPDTVADRSIPIALKRKVAHEQVNRFRFREAGEQATPIRDGLARWSVGAVSLLRDARPPSPPELDDRAEEGWEPLLAIADLAGGDWPARARRAAVALSGDAAAEDESTGARLLADLREFFDGKSIATATILEHLNKLEESPWGTWNNGTGMRPHELARGLKPYGIKPKNVRLPGGVFKGYDSADFQDAFRRYVPLVADLSATTLQPQLNQLVADGPQSDLNQGNIADGSQIENRYNCSVVADKSVERGDREVQSAENTSELPSPPPDTEDI